MIFYGFSRTAYGLGCVLIILSIFLGHFNIGKIFLTNDIFRALGKLTFEAALLHPIVIMYFYGSTQGGLYLTFVTVIYFGIGNIICNVIAAFGVFMLIEYPCKRLVELYITP
jgi:hypothetical protein